MSTSFIRKRALYKRKTTEHFSRSFSSGRSLLGETIYSQTLDISNDKSLDDIISSYVENVVNDTKHVFPAGPVFYKGSIVCEQSRGEYTIHFHLYTNSVWNEDIQALAKKTYFEALSKQIAGLSLKSERLLQPLRNVVQGAVDTNISDERSHNGAEDNIHVADTEREMITTFLRGDSLTRWSFLDILKDMYIFDVSHTTFLSRWVHFIATPINMILSMMFLSQFYLIGGPRDSIINLNVSHILIILLVASYMRLGTIRNCELWAITVSIVLLCLSLTGRSLYIRVCGYESCSEGIYFLPLVLGFFTSLCQITSDHLYSDSSTGDISLEMLKNILYGFTFDTSLSLDDQLRQVVAFVLTNIGYRPSGAEVYIKYLRRCEQNGLDIYHRLPKSSREISRMSMSSPCVLALKEYGLMKKEAFTTSETLSLCVTIRLCSMYLRKY
ncbi:uncharacterized protein LOC125683722 isoform X2 [Ostrea edulis]|uniref:uncharacterized protein LOC125683722 isoform X2 n=1 Tax=Ostrea edulis TaxID=37623 RepID=UPI0024AF2C95|nr:uncharacterized protein LOC125683722 isoform X2 [Ostrea edulis]